MNIPKIKFREMTLKENIDLIKWAYFEKNDSLDVHNYTIQYFSELANIDGNASIKQINTIIERIVTFYYEKNSERIKQEVDRYSTLWLDYNDEYFKKLSEFLEVDWPKNIKTIDASVGLIPIFPRYLDKFSFSTGTGVDKLELIETCAHETLHFLWFEKWKEIHPEILRREYDSPYITWKYSEMVTDPILNNEPFARMFEFVEHGYDSFYKISDGDELLMDKLRSIYSENISIEEKINVGFELAKSSEKNYKCL